MKHTVRNIVALFPESMGMEQQENKDLLMKAIKSGSAKVGIVNLDGIKTVFDIWYLEQHMYIGEMEETEIKDGYVAPDESVWESREAYEEHTGRKAQETDNGSS